MWRSAEAGTYQSPGNADSACGSLWSWTIGNAAASSDGGHVDLISISDYIGCGRALRPVNIKVLIMLIVLVVVFGHGQLAMLLLIEMVDMRIFIVFLITLVVAER